jgi:rhamnogalacturonyl hydrolase YesR
MKKIIVDCLYIIMLLPLMTGCGSLSKNSISGRKNAALFQPEQIRATMLKVTEWQLTHPKYEYGERDWTHGALYAGVFAAYETTWSKEIFDALLAMGEKTRWLPGKNVYNSDDMAICQTYIDLYRKDKRQEMIQPTLDSIHKFISTPYPDYKASWPPAIFRWWWCDALFMGPPTLVKLGMTTGNREYLQKCDEYYRECYDLLYDREERLFSRDLNYLIKNDSKDKYEANGKKIFWGRGNGWVLGGLVRILKELPTDYSNRPFYENLFRELATRIASLQQTDGLWRTSLLDPDSYPGGEVSGSGFYCYALAYGVNSGLLDRKAYLPAVQKAWIALNQCVNEEGRVGWVQPIGAAPGKNITADSWEVFGTGAFLLAGSEVIKLRQ